MNVQIVMEHLGVTEDTVGRMSPNQFARVLAFIKISRKANDGMSNKEAALANRLGI